MLTDTQQQKLNKAKTQNLIMNEGALGGGT